MTPFLKTWLLPIVILLGVNMAFLSPSYFQGDVLDQDDIKLGWAKSKEIRDHRASKGEKSRCGQMQCLAACPQHKYRPSTEGIFLKPYPP